MESFAKLGRLWSEYGFRKDCFRIKYEGKRYRIPLRGQKDHIIDQMRRRKSFYEVDLLSLLNDILDDIPGAAIDIGANIGNHSLFFAGVLNRETVSFEPVPANSEILERVMQLNNLSDRVCMFPFAVGDSERTVRLGVLDEANPGMYSTTVHGGEIEARQVTLDQMIDDLPSRIALVKIDVEGVEEAVLAGAKRLLAERRPVVAVEIQTTESFDACSDLLMRCGIYPRHLRCATPTVVFEPAHSPETTLVGEIRRKIEEFQRSAGTS